MKFRLIYSFFALATGAYLLMGNASGAGANQNADLTGSPLSAVSCSFCHGGGNFSPSLVVQVLDDGTPVTSYHPDSTYTLHVAVNAGNGTPSRYGFQAVALRGSANQGAGAFGTPPAGMRKTTVSNRVYVEHNTPSVSNTFEVSWTAPAAGTGDVRFYAAGNATNNNDNTTGDQAVRLTTPITLTEATPSNLVNTNLFEQLSVWPNPVQESVNIRAVAADNGRFRMQVLDTHGRMLHSEQVTFSAGENLLRREWKDLTSGVYFIQFSDGQQLSTLRILKR